MNLAIASLHPLFAAELRGVDLAGDIDGATEQAIEQAMDRYAVCVLPDQTLDDERQIAFSRRYGPLENASAVKAQRKAGVMGTRIRHPEIFDVSNLDENGTMLPADDERWRYRLANELWHSDSSFRQRASTWSLLHARIVPPSGGETYFADTRAAYDALPQTMKEKIEGLVAEHSIWHSRGQRGGYVPSAEERAARPPAQHPLVRRHPGSGRKALFIASHASHIVGWPHEEGRALLDELMAFATQPRFVYGHKWRVGDLVIWTIAAPCTAPRRLPPTSTGANCTAPRSSTRAAIWPSACTERRTSRGAARRDGRLCAFPPRRCQSHRLLLSASRKPPDRKRCRARWTIWPYSRRPAFSCCSGPPASSAPSSASLMSSR